MAILNFLLSITTLLFILSTTHARPSRNRFIPAFLRRTTTKRSSYTPLLFFTEPPGVNPACDATDRLLRRLERDGHLRIERIDLHRNEKGWALLELINRGFSRPGDIELPALYNRESRQLLRGDTKVMTEQRIRAWAKGRLVRVEKKKKTVKPPPEVVKRAEFLERMGMTKEQVAAMRMMEERTKELASDRTE